jgi:uncharacterized protein YigA (DUF484 family)
MFGDINFNSVLLGLLNLLIGGVLVTIIRTRVPLKKIANDREANLLTERAEDMEAMRGEIAELKAELKKQANMHDAQRAIDRHRINNLTACLDAFLMLVKQDPSKAAEAAAIIEEMRAKQMMAEAAEKGATRGEPAKGSAK